MKIRIGFVSNSSTSSFIAYATISTVAKSMFNTVIDDYSSWGERIDRATKRLYQEWRKNLYKGLRRKRVKNGEMGITMSSCNYDTYIAYKNGRCYVATCNNHLWDERLIDTYIPEESESEIKNILNEFYFYNIRNGLIHSSEKYLEDRESNKLQCPNCTYFFGGYVVDEKNNQICAHCFEGIIGKRIDEMKILKAKQKKFPNPINTLEL